MLRVLVADDEPRQRKGIASIIRTIRPEYEVLEFKTGMEVCQYLENDSADIIFTDIKMPMMDGLQLIEKVKEKKKEITVVILSGYACFEYAQQALALGAFDYILKPIDQDKVYKVLTKIERKIDADITDKQEKHSLEKKLDHALPAYMEALLNRWIKGHLIEGELKEIEFLFQSSSMGVVIVSEISNYSILMQKYTNEEKEEIRLTLKQWMKHVINPLGHSISFFLEAQSNIMITVFNMDNESILLSKQSIDKFKSLIDDLKTSYGFVMTIGMGSVFKDVIEQIETSFSQAMTALNYKFFYGLGSVIPYAELCTKLEQNQVYIKFSEEDRLIESIRYMQKDTALSLLDCILIRLKGEYYPDPVTFKETISHVIINAINLTQTILIVENYNEFLSRSKKTILNCDEYHQFAKKSKEILLEVMDILNSNKSIKNENFSKKFIKYLEEHYMEDVSLESAAQIFNINPCYFSSLLKNMIGTTFGQSVLGIRIKKAKDLLREPDLKIYEIASMVGYKDIRYFDRVFKKETGLSPEVYRKSIMAE